ncbi:HAD-IIIC family phosphatase [Gehongia tenuis]|uniref:HAD-IIIC family phosphatase n=1 Tax=Gehongia tenuis TaxID=2763655 RepID=A0A926D3L0_9FIRM|nr:HAD-IIIC family phosphatase [Gehongia tenuis]MBC8530727.1 HAD-IIIC family phosphatase [Gehongia tenuis]
MSVEYSWKDIKTAAQLAGDMTRSLVIIGDFATQHLAVALQGTFVLSHIDYAVHDTDYDQINAQILDPDSELYQASPDAVLFACCTAKLYDAYCSTPLNDRIHFAEKQAEILASFRQRLIKQTHCKIFQLTYPLMDDATFGNYACKVESSFPFQLKKLNYLLGEAALNEPGYTLIDMDLIQARLGQADFASDKMYFIARMPYSQKTLQYIAAHIADILRSAMGHIHKCVVLDLDNTLWGGVIGDDGIHGIEIGELGIGRAFLCFQQWLKELQLRGILLAVCSKNNEATAKEPFEKHPDMLLKLDDFAIFVANWEDKASNIKFIQKSLNIGMDSMVFIDDNVFERNVVRSLIPDIVVPEMPEDPAEYVSYLRRLNLFETTSYSDNDASRTQQYQERMKSLKAQAEFSNYDDYLKSLEMKATVSAFDPFHYPRIAQLTQRSNQFNLRTGRYTEDEIADLANNPQVITIWFGLKDRFASHGLISLVILDKRDENTLFVREWLMSCRVLKRGMEEYVADTIIRTAAENGFDTVVGEYLPTAKNGMVADLYERMGFDKSGESFVAHPDTYHYHTTHIDRENET